ncbi:hypothetical protein [Candidatus Colwellia aromaticivorans]|uniref:hypothetical protein n=1 Tax=Candidatus Colwellia aromaticivorans TaxID=2267621 RepID=UPI000DF18B44|nr:hypothetical protein [Candidatus Colwellia aromaticivorans]
MLIRLVITSILLLASAFLQADTLKPFTSDGCSAFPDGTFDQKNLWLECCQQHDYDYWQGGTYQQRLVSDKQLKACVTQVGEPTIAALMLAGVRVGGTPYLPTSFRWGYGWGHPRLYGALSIKELAQVAELSTHLPFVKEKILKNK